MQFLSFLKQTFFLYYKRDFTPDIFSIYHFIFSNIIISFHIIMKPSNFLNLLLIKLKRNYRVKKS